MAQKGNTSEERLKSEGGREKEETLGIPLDGTADPTGEIIAGPLPDYEEGILYAEVDKRTVVEERQNFDYSGHYSRPELLNLERN